MTAVPAPARPRVVILRGHQANPWELRPWESPAIADRFDVSYLRTGSGLFDTSPLRLADRRVWALRDLLPPGRIGDGLVRLPGDRYLGLGSRLRDADIVHSQELGYWYTSQAAKLKARLGYRLVLTVWETLPQLDAYRNIRTRPYRRDALAETDLFLPTTERARQALLLEGVADERIRVAAPGVDLRRFQRLRPEGDDPAARRGAPVIVSPGRLVWEKGHQDVMRALALLRERALSGASPRLALVGTGPYERRLREYARDLGLADNVDFRGFVPYTEMPEVFADASCMVLASLPVWWWEEQFGMVLAEAIAAGVPVVASRCGAIPEVAGSYAEYFAPGDWVGLADALERVLSSPSTEVGVSELATRYSADAAAERLAAAYDDVLSRTSRA